MRRRRSGIRRSCRRGRGWRWCGSRCWSWCRSHRRSARPCRNSSNSVSCRCLTGGRCYSRPVWKYQVGARTVATAYTLSTAKPTRQSNITTTSCTVFTAYASCWDSTAASTANAVSTNVAISVCGQGEVSRANRPYDAGKDFQIWNVPGQQVSSRLVRPSKWIAPTRNSLASKSRRKFDRGRLNSWCGEALVRTAVPKINKIVITREGILILAIS